MNRKQWREDNGYHTTKQTPDNWENRCAYCANKYGLDGGPDGKARLACRITDYRVTKHGVCNHLSHRHAPPPR